MKLFPVSLLTFALAAALTACHPTDSLSDALVQAGLEKARAGEFADAERDFTAALSIKPGHAEAHFFRAFARGNQDNNTGALADIDDAIRLDPRRGDYYGYRAALRLSNGEPQTALADNRRALDLTSPPESRYFAQRSSIDKALGDFEAALADLDRAIEIDPGISDYYEGRAVLRMQLRRWAGAAADLRQRLTMTTDNEDYMQFFLWICRHKLGEGPAADADLKKFADARGVAGDWPGKIASFLLGPMKPEDLAAAAGANSGQVCEAWYYIAIREELTGHAEAARTAYQRCQATNRTAFIEYTLATTALKEAEGGGKAETPSAR